jgi:hypothetical protein
MRPLKDIRGIQNWRRCEFRLIGLLVHFVQIVPVIGFQK